MSGLPEYRRGRNFVSSFDNVEEERDSEVLREEEAVNNLKEEEAVNNLKEYIANNPVTSGAEQLTDDLLQGNEITPEKLKQAIIEAEKSPTVPVQEYEQTITIKVPNYITNPDKYDIAILGTETAFPYIIKGIKSNKNLYKTAKLAYIAGARAFKFGTGQYNVLSRTAAATRKFGSRVGSTTSRGLSNMGSATRKLGSRVGSATSSGLSNARSAASSGLSRASTGFSNMRNRFSSNNQGEGYSALTDTPYTVTQANQYGQPFVQQPQPPPRKKFLGLFGGVTAKHRRRHKSKRSKRSKTRRHKK